MDVYTVASFEWMYPQWLDKTPLSENVIYRQPQLQAIMQGAKTQKNRLKTYKRVFLKDDPEASAKPSDASTSRAPVTDGAGTEPDGGAPMEVE